MNEIPARWFTPVGPSRPKRKIVLHSMEAPNKPDTAEGVGNFFARLPAGNKASAHVGADVNSLCRYVSDDNVAYAAPGANHDGLHIELAGYARFNAGDWNQADMMAMIQQGAQQVRTWSDQYRIPLRFITAADMRADPNVSGVTTHYEVSQAFHGSDHWDPGTGFPIATTIHMAASGSVPLEGDDVVPYFYEPCPTGGYWLIKKADGGVFCFDGAPFFGALPGAVSLQAPIVALSPYTKSHLLGSDEVKGYWMLSADGGVFCFGEAPFVDSYAGHPELQQGARDFVGISQKGEGYLLMSVGRNTDPPQPNAYDWGR